MPIGKYITYKCKKCGYIFTEFQSDALIPMVCSKCNGEVEILYSSCNPINGYFKYLSKIIEKFLRRKK